MPTYEHAVMGRGDSLPAMTGHWYISTKKDKKTIRLNVKELTATSGDKNMVQIKPYQTVTTTGGIKGLEINPKLADACGIATIQGLDCCVEIKGTTGTISGKVWALRAKLESGTGDVRSKAGPFAMLSCKNSLHGSVTNGVYVLDIETVGGNCPWTAFALLPDDGQLASDSGTATPGAHGWIKVVVGSATRYIGLVNTPS